MFVELRCSWGGAWQVVFHHSLVEDVGGVAGAGAAAAGSWLRLDHDLWGVEGRLVDGDGAILLADVLSWGGRGQADHLVVVVFSLDPDLLELAFANVFVGVVFVFFLLALPQGEA